MQRLKRILSKEIIYYLITITLSCFILARILQIWSADLAIPFDYHWDTLLNGVTIKGIIENGWFMSNPFIGAPHGFTYYDFNSNANIDMVMLKLISLIFPNWAMTLNVYFLLTFPLVAISSLFVFRRLKISPLPAITGSLLFTFAPFHFLQGEFHINLSAYYLVPLIVLVCLWVSEDDFSLKLFIKSPIDPAKRNLNRKAFLSIIICILMGSTFIYFPFFSCFFLLVTGVCATISRKNWNPVLNSCLLIGVTVIFAAGYYLPSFIYQNVNGTNDALARLPQATEIYGLKIVQLLIPVVGHRNDLFALIADKYNVTSPFVNENQSAALGLIGAIGFIALIIWIPYRLFSNSSVSSSETSKKINQLSMLNLSAVALGTIGGFGTLFAYLVFPQIRTYTRISIFIAFFSILTVVLMAELFIKKTTFSRLVVVIIMVGALVFGIFDQASVDFTPEYQSIKKEFLNDKAFIRDIETRLPADSMVFQLPYVPFPEGPKINRMADYDLFRGYLHSTSIKWSYGTIKGRYGGFWQHIISNKPLDEMIPALSIADFSGIYLDSYGYTDNGKEEISKISLILNETPVKSLNGRLYFFDMRQFNTELKSRYIPEEYEKQKLKIMYPLYFEFRDGFSAPVRAQDSGSHLSSNRGTMLVTNYTEKARKFTLDTIFQTGYPEPAILKIESEIVSEELTISGKGYHYVKELAVPPGKHEIQFTCDAENIYIPTEFKFIVFGMFKTTIIESD